MSPEWGSLPLLPLRCVLEHLSLEDALAAMSTCRHWRNAALLYEGHKETLKLDVKCLEKCLFLTRLFKKHVKNIYIYLHANDKELDNFMNYILPQFFDTEKLQELVFVGPRYIQRSQRWPIIKLKRKIAESLIFKHLHILQKLALLGCEMDVARTNKDLFAHKHIEYYSRPLSFNHSMSPGDTVLSRCNIGLVVFSALQHIIVDYENMNTEALETLLELASFSRLTLNVTYRRHMTYRPIDWDRVDASHRNGLEVAVNIIAVPEKKFDEIIDNVMREGMPLTSLKVMFCNTFYQPMIQHVVRVYKESLHTLVWVDCPQDACEPRMVGRHRRRIQYGMCNVNPFVLLSWQCTQLRRLVLHGYWVWQYDLLGCVRLRKSLSQLEVSCVCRLQDELGSGDTPRRNASDTPRALDHTFIQEMNEYTEFRWEPVPWAKLHPGLRVHAPPALRAQYAAHHALQPLGVT